VLSTSTKFTTVHRQFANICCNAVDVHVAQAVSHVMSPLFYDVTSRRFVVSNRRFGTSFRAKQLAPEDEIDRLFPEVDI